jgi:hypothetical protein
MKKTTILLYFTFLPLIFCISCKKQPVSPNTPPRVDFKATTTEYTKGGPKVFLTDFTPMWKAGDRFLVVGSDLTPHRCWTANDSTDMAYFKYDTVPAAPVSGPYTAFFPTEVYLSPTQIILPPSYQSATGTLTNAPMYASSNDSNLTFYNLCGVVCLNILGEEAKMLQYIILNADKRIHGVFDLVENPDNPYCPQLSYNNSGSTSTILTLTNPAQGDGYFYIPIPAGTYNSLSIYLTTYENSYANATLGDGSPITISQNAIFPFTIDNLSFSGPEK